MNLRTASHHQREHDPEPAVRSLLPPGPALRELAQLRRALYRFLAALFLPPTEERCTQLVEAAQAFRAEQETLATFPWYLSWQPLLDRLATGPHLAAAELQETYVWLFLTGPGGPPCCPPCSSWYLDPEQHAAGWVPLALERAYATVGLAVSPTLLGTPDHISVMLEFMAVLCDREADTWIHEARLDTRKVLRQEQRFLQRFLIPWLPSFVRDLIRCDQTGLYKASADACAALTGHDLDLLTLLLEQVAEKLR